MVTVRHPLDSMSPKEIAAAASAIADDVVRGLVGDRGVKARNSAA